MRDLTNEGPLQKHYSCIFSQGRKDHIDFGQIEDALGGSYATFDEQ